MASFFPQSFAKILQHVAGTNADLIRPRKGYRCLRNNLLPEVSGMDPPELASLMPGSWNPVASWLRQIDAVRQAV